MIRPSSPAEGGVARRPQDCNSGCDGSTTGGALPGRGMITLCVPTYNRPAFIERLLRYYAATSSRHWIFIGASSDPNDAKRPRA
ncbi:MAG: hypothetical protein HYY90_03985 [Candidatus Omnitrophica bacterium]|nr:hypothetical protein [Candidatus Omnitrophota bacterium]